jgi:hypothetical protein
MSSFEYRFTNYNKIRTDRSIRTRIRYGLHSAIFAHLLKMPKITALSKTAYCFDSYNFISYCKSLRSKALRLAILRVHDVLEVLLGLLIISETKEVISVFGRGEVQ